MTAMQIFAPLPAAVEAALRESIRRFGVLVPIMVDQHGRTLDGHHRRRIAEEERVEFETTVVEVTDDEQAREIAYTLNADRRQLDADQRREVVAALRQAGHSFRAIADALRASKSQIERDASSTVPDGTVPDRIVGLDGKSRPAQRPAEPMEPNPAIAEFVDSGQHLQDIRYRRAFLKSLSGMSQFVQFDAERLGRICEPAEAEQLEMWVASYSEFVERFKAARSGLRLVNGGK